MAKPVMEIRGLSEWLADLKQAPDHLRRRAAQAVATSTFAAENRARSTVARRTGRLAAAIHSSVTGTSGRVLIDDVAYYWRMVEHGTIHQNAQPFARPAAEQEAPNFERNLEAIARDFSVSRFL